jgi:hypothetical protein
MLLLLLPKATTAITHCRVSTSPPMDPWTLMPGTAGIVLTKALEGAFYPTWSPMGPSACPGDQH